MPFEWGYFPDTKPSFPAEISDAIIREGALPGILGDCHASGTQVIEDFGEEKHPHRKPIIYTSVDSVMQIAAHETHFGWSGSTTSAAASDADVRSAEIGRVIARPFVGERRGAFQRTPNRKDFRHPAA